MFTLVPLAHGVFGIWDELIPLFILIGFGVLFALSAVVNHQRNKSLTESQNTPDSSADTTDDSENAPRPDHIRLD